MAIADTPLAGTLFAASLAVMVGEGHAPVVAVLVPGVHRAMPPLWQYLFRACVKLDLDRWAWALSEAEASEDEAAAA